MPHNSMNLPKYPDRADCWCCALLSVTVTTATSATAKCLIKAETKNKEKDVMLSVKDHIKRGLRATELVMNDFVRSISSQ